MTSCGKVVGCFAAGLLRPVLRHSIIVGAAAPSQRKPFLFLRDLGVITKGASPWRQFATAAAQTDSSSSDNVNTLQPKRVAKAPRKKRDVMEVTEAAVRRIKELVEQKDPMPHGIRLGVRTRGCNGLSYTLNYVDEPQKLDEVVEADGIKVYIDPKAVMYLVGSRMDFVEDAVKAEFVFENPNAKGACGCGESFNV